MADELTSGHREAFAACDADWDRAETLPAAAYTDEALYRRERGRVFRSGWVGVGRNDRWTAVGAYAEVEVGGVSVIVTRTEDGLAAYANNCRHRYTPLVEGEGNCRRFVCPFHNWTYSLDGRLIGVPDMHRTVGFDKADYGLVPVALAEYLGFVFVCLAADVPSIEAWFGNFGELHASWPLADLRTSRRRTFTVDCNWKNFAEVFNEYYHLPYVHADSIDDLYDRPDDAEATEGAFATQFGTTETTKTAALLADEMANALPSIAGLEGQAVRGVRYSWLFPNIMIGLGSEGMWMYEVYPDGPNRCRVAQVIAFPAETMAVSGFADKVEAYYRRFDVAISEDIPILERQQRGMGSPLATPGRYSWLEPSVATFARWHSRRMTESSSP